VQLDGAALTTRALEDDRDMAGDEPTCATRNEHDERVDGHELVEHVEPLLGERGWDVHGLIPVV
jgi:hypothetical protein